MRSSHPKDMLTNPEAAQLLAHVLGPVRIAINDRIISDLDWPRRSGRSLVLLLLVSPGHRLARERLIDLLWPEAAPGTGMNALRVALHSARRTLEPKLLPGETSMYLHSEGDSITLGSPAGLSVDADEFEAALARLPSAPGSERPTILRTAISLYGGQLLDGEPDTEWSYGRREHLHRIWRDAVLELSEVDFAEGSLRSVPVLQQLLDIDSADEGAHRALMRTFMAAGQRDEALRQYARCADALQRELEVEPAAETTTLAAEIRASSLAYAPSVGLVHGRMTSLPIPPNPLIGRLREMEILEGLLLNDGVRLVTLTGPGGIGKTRLALEAARILEPELAVGVCFVDLSAISDFNLVIPTILRAIGLDEVPGFPAMEVLVRTVGASDLLLVLDNLEQVIAASTDISALLASCSGVTILATSRQPLRLRAEHIVTITSLAVPSAATHGRSGGRGGRLADRYDAVTLFMERARAARPGFEITDGNESAVAALCARLDGLPLAIELAAAWIRHLAPDELLAQLVPRLPMLTGGARDLPARQRTLGDAIAWSYDLLEDMEKVLFRRLSVFAGDFCIEAARIICASPDADPGQVARTVWGLADKNLLQRQEGAGGAATRYKMLETIREFSLEHLVSSGEGDVIRNRHVAWCLALAEEAEPRLHGPDQIPRLEQLEQEHDNLRSALEWAYESGEADKALRLSGALSEFWRMNGYLGEGRAWLERTLALAEDTPSVTRALATRGAGVLAQAQGDTEVAITRLEQALSDWRALGDNRRIAQTIGLLADIARAQGEYDRSVQLNEEALALFEEIGFTPGVADALNHLGIIASDRAEYGRAEDFFKRSSDIFTELGDRHGSARVLNNRGSLSFWQENYKDAVAFYDRSLHLWRALGHRPHTALVLANLGESLRAEGDLEQAMSVTREGLDVSREVGDRRSEATALFILGSLIQHREYDFRAVAPLVDGLRLYHQVGDRLGMAWCLEALAGAATAQGQSELAAQLLGAAEALRDEVGIALKPAELAAYERHLNATKLALDSAAVFEAAWSTGRALSPAELIGFAAGIEVGNVQPAGHSRSVAHLGRTYGSQDAVG